MKIIVNILSIVAIAALSIVQVNAQELNSRELKSKIVTSEFKVSGVCDMCKERIENAALIKGVKKAEWDKQTQMLTVIYNSEKTEEDNIHEAIAEVGHDTEKVKSEDKAAAKLPECCGYRSGVKTH